MTSDTRRLGQANRLAINEGVTLTQTDRDAILAGASYRDRYPVPEQPLLGRRPARSRSHPSRVAGIRRPS